MHEAISDLIHPFVYGISANKKRAEDSPSSAPLLFTMLLYRFERELSIAFLKFDVSHIFDFVLAENNCGNSTKLQNFTHRLLTFTLQRANINAGTKAFEQTICLPGRLFIISVQINGALHLKGK